MARSVTVSFADGSSHTYDNVPDDIDQQKVEDRARMEFSNREVTGAGAGAPPSMPEQHEPSIGTKIAGAAQTAYNYGTAPIKFAMEHPIATGVGISMLPESVTSKIPGINQAAQYGRGALQRLTGVTPVSPAAQQTFNAVSQPASEAAPNIMQRGMDIASKMRQIAAERVVAPAANAATAAAPYARGLGGVAAAVTPGNMGQNYGAHFPQAGPQRGQEINPQTNRPWTPQELAMYNSMNR